MKLATRAWTISLDHAAIATKEPEKLKQVLRLLGLLDEGQEPVPSQGVVTHFFKSSAADEAAQVEILEVLDPAGSVAKYLEKKGPGIHHLSFKINGKANSLPELCEELRSHSIRLIYDSPKPGAHGTQVNFIHPESTGGILIEISEIAP